MYRIVIFGGGSTAKRVIRGIRKNVEVISFLDNDSKKWGQKFEGININKPEYIKQIEYDFIVILSQEDYMIYSQLLSMGVKKEKIFRYVTFFIFINNILKNKISLYEKNREKFEILVTGLSYFVEGINVDILSKGCINFSYDSQDLYYDYKIAKYLIENKNSIFKYCIIGLSYYSFQYDLSLSNMKNNVNIYYDVFKDSHNFYIKDRKFIENKIKVKEEMNIAYKIFNVSYKNVNGSDIYGIYFNNESFIEFKDEKNKQEIGLMQAEKDCNKNYPNTVSENIKIIKEYLYLLKSHNIKPIIVVCPTSKYYYNNFSDVIKEEFFSIINNLRKEFTFQFIDYFDSNEFDDGDFRDVSHLNTSGGDKFTQILNREIEW